MKNQKRKTINEPVFPEKQKKKIQQIIYDFVEKEYGGGVDLEFRKTKSWCKPLPFSIALAEKIAQTL